MQWRGENTQYTDMFIIQRGPHLIFSGPRNYPSQLHQFITLRLDPSSISADVWLMHRLIISCMCFNKVNNHE
ncbi:Predicted protein [Komagataella phaffii CBS 7435]|nr:Predicted protein [Komagataella phaffii CBS 7435]